MKLDTTLQKLLTILFVLLLGMTLVVVYDTMSSTPNIIDDNDSLRPIVVHNIATKDNVSGVAIVVVDDSKPHAFGRPHEAYIRTFFRYVDYETAILEETSATLAKKLNIYAVWFITDKEVLEIINGEN